MNVARFVQRLLSSKNTHTVVTFTGGMGAQIISAAIYFSMKNSGRSVSADLSYFLEPERVAVVGNHGEVSHWAWQLEAFGLLPASFDPTPDGIESTSQLLRDGPRKLELGLNALAQAEVQKLFKVPVGISDILSEEFGANYLCVHVRRGDYVNVASHLIADDEFARLVRKFRGLVDNAVVISDSPIEPGLRAGVSSCFSNAAFLDKIDPFAAHRIMRSARVLICSNSTFSLTAAALNPDALSLIPKQWFEGDDRKVEAAIHGRCQFQILENDPRT